MNTFARKHLMEQCIFGGNVDGVKKLFEDGYGEGICVVHLAALSIKSEEMLKMLIIDCKCDPNEKDGRGYTPLFTALEYNGCNYDVKTVTTLINLGADPHYEVCNKNVISTPYSSASEEIQDLIDNMAMETKGGDW